MSEIGVALGSHAPNTTPQQDGLNNYENNFLDVDQDIDIDILDYLNLPQEHCSPLDPPIPPIPLIMPVQLKQPLSYNIFPHAFFENLAFLQDMIANIQNAQLKNNINNINVLYQLCNPSRDVFELDKQTQISLEMFSALATHPKLAYEEAHCVFNKICPDSPFHSYWVVKSCLEKLSGIT
jgi:hypothetical protein